MTRQIDHRFILTEAQVSKGLETLAAVKTQLNLPVITDVHTVEEAAVAAQVADIIQLPAFLARQTDLVQAMATRRDRRSISKSRNF